VIDRAAGEARERQASEIDTAHLLLALCDDEESLAFRILESVGSSGDEVRAALEALLS
jgi:ATP-dependent Clp protease ATP-binding subunit ClpA